MRFGTRLHNTVALMVVGLGAAGVNATCRADERPQLNQISNYAPVNHRDSVYRLRLYHLHTGESLDVVYRIGDMYIPDALDQLDHFLRDHRTQDASRYDPREFDLLHSIMARLGRPDGVIDIVCGYRTPWSNAYLRHGTASSGVAEHSQHMEAKAIDIRVPGVATAALRDAAESFEAGGVGYYPVSQFVHVDVGPVRRWAFGVPVPSGGRSNTAGFHHRSVLHPNGN